MAFVLPHENKAMRLPVVPAAHTALLETMSDGTWPVADTTARRAFLCRDPCYPLWVEKSCTAVSVYLQSTGSAGSWSIPAQTNRVLILPQWDLITSAIPGGSTIDGTTTTLTSAVDNFVIGSSTNGTCWYVPPGAQFGIRIYTAATGGGDGIEFEFVWRQAGEDYVSTLIATSTGDGFQFIGLAGSALATTGILGEGVIPFGFVSLRTVRTRSVAPTVFAAPLLQIGWFTGGTIFNPTSTAMLMLPYVMPPEFNNSTIPYSRSRLNASAALFTNVTAALSKEGTILAGRLKDAIVDPWNFTATNINSVHPSLRYFGPLEKGLYTFSTPSANVDNFSDCVMSMPSPSTFNALSRPLFQWQDVGIYNAMIFSDLGSSGAGTQLAVSSYNHIEFETTSSLFTLGVSMATLEMLHATEVALLKFGHFHENPLHWAALRAAASLALRVVGPMVAPIVQHYATKAVDAGVSYLRGKSGGDRKMKQSAPYAAGSRKKPVPKRTGKKRR